MSRYLPSDHQSRPEIVIVGAGFAGLACAAGLGDTSFNVTVVDRRNHNLFQPLLYQVATAALSPADIAEPVRRTLGRYGNIRVMLGEVVRVDSSAQQILLRDGATPPTTNSSSPRARNTITSETTNGSPSRPASRPSTRPG